MKENTVKARIHSLAGEFAEVTIVKFQDYNNVVAEYNGSFYTAVFNPCIRTLAPFFAEC